MRSRYLCRAAMPVLDVPEAGWEDGTLTALVDQNGTAARFWPDLVADLDRWGRDTAMFNAGHVLKSLTPDEALRQLLDRDEMADALTKIGRLDDG